MYPIGFTILYWDTAIRIPLIIASKEDFIGGGRTRRSRPLFTLCMVSRMANELPTLDFNDTFLDMDHLRSSFADYKMDVKVDDPSKLVPPFRVTFKRALHKRRKAEGEPVDEEEAQKDEKSIIVEPYVIPSRGPYLHFEPKK